jgi:hypothetical protein
MNEVTQRGSTVLDNYRIPQKKTYIIAECCGEELPCFGAINVCPICGTHFNSMGQPLVPIDCREDSLHERDNQAS